jgi:hypothetical protein
MEVQGQFGMQFQVKLNGKKLGYVAVLISGQQLHIFKLRTVLAYLNKATFPPQKSEIKQVPRTLHFISG